MNGLEFMGKEWDRLGATFKAPQSDGAWAAAHGATRKGFDGYSATPSYTVPAGNIKCPDCGRWKDGRDPAKEDPRKGYRCVCGGVQREQRRLVNDRIQTWHLAWLAEAFRVLRPGGVIKAFGGTRTFHRLVGAMIDAGFVEIGVEAWTYGSGFPKSLNVPKAIDASIRCGGSNSQRLRQTEQETGGEPYTRTGSANGFLSEERGGTGSEPRVWDRKAWSPATPEGRTWRGWGTALKPAWEPVVTGRKP